MKRLVLGDWSRVVRDPIDVLRLAFLVAAVVAFARGDLDDATRLALTVLATLGARALALPRLFDLAFVIGMALQAFGNVAGLFESFRYYDLVVHFALPLACAPCLYITLARLDVVPDLAHGRPREHHLLGIFLITFALGFSLGALYEIYEWAADHWLGASLAVGYDDTISDLVDDALASLLGGGFLVLWATRGWATTRRVPAEIANRRATSRAPNA
jgi:hypothetical protein